MKEPGNLTDLEGPAQRAWDALVERLFAASRSAHLLGKRDRRTTQLVSVDWGADAVRTTACLGSGPRSQRLLDWVTPQEAVGRAYLQDEYFEWRTVRNEAGKVVRVEMTTEFPEYWSILAAHDPVKTLALVARFAGERSVRPEAVYGGLNPFAAGVGPRERMNAFDDAMRPFKGKTPWSPYNNGTRAICFLTQGSNNLGALVGLAIPAAVPYAAKDPATRRLRPLTGPEAIASGTQSAQACRNSDPTVVESLIGLASQGMVFALDDPIGVYITSVQHDRLLQPNGESVPKEWFQFQRGSRPRGSDRFERSQRLVFEVPPGMGFVAGDLVDADSDQRIEYGGQVASLVQLSVHVRVSRAGAVPVRRREVRLPRVPPCDEDPGCSQINKLWRQYQSYERNLLAGTPAGGLDRAGGEVL